MNTFKCKNEFKVNEYVDDEETHNLIKIEVNSIWKRKNNNYIGQDVHLERVDDYGWIEISEETFVKNFVRNININEIEKTR